MALNRHHTLLTSRQASQLRYYLLEGDGACYVKESVIGKVLKLAVLNTYIGELGKLLAHM